ncbi:MAG: DUF3656 domain-containing protein [Coriobacteriia bacterium]
MAVTEHPPKRRPELLAPAGGPASLVAAVNNGADAVYAGLGTFNARRGADNFDERSLAEATRFAHLRGARVYLTANTVVLPDEMQAAIEVIDTAWAAGVDAVIIQDLGLMRVVRKALPEVRIHASTQINAHNAASVAALAELGAARVTLAREVSVAEIRALVKAGGDTEVESFVHGALCYSYSGQCLMSSMIGGRSANRGLCAQPCRLPYELIDATGETVPVEGRYLLSPRDLAGIAMLPEIVDTGVAALKIEGRMKSPEYVAVVVGVYRAALDRAIADPAGFAVTEAEWELLAEAFNRGFTDGYLAGISDERVMSRRRPNNRGVLVGRVAHASGGRATIALDRQLAAEDTIEFWTSRGRAAQRAGVLRQRDVAILTAPAGSRVEIETQAPVSAGDRVFRVANAAMLDAARRTFEGRDALERRATPVDIRVRVVSGKPLEVVASAAGVEASATGPVVEPARTKAVTADEVIEHVGRLGGSGYVAASWDVDLEMGVGVGFSALHRVRREALEALDTLRLAPWSGRQRRHPVVAPPKGRGPSRPEVPALVAVTDDVAEVEALLSAGADRVAVRVGAETAAPLPEHAYALVPRIAHEAEFPALVAWAATDGEIASANLGLLREAVIRGARLEADQPLNVANPWSARALDSLGTLFVWASPELTLGQIEALVGSSPLPVGVVVYGRTELMVAEHCVLQAAGACSGRCAGCARRRAFWTLRDEKGYGFPVTTDITGRTHVYNAVTLDLSRALDQVVGTGVHAVRLDFSTESREERVRIVAAFRGLLRDVASGRALPEQPLVTPATSGHLFRGVR